jgi:hypothetical protein
VEDNYRRHEILQRFMLANASVTLAVEVPIWLTLADIRALERHHGIKLRSDGKPSDQTITGHIDFVQIRKWRRAHSRLQARRAHEQTIRPTHHLRAGIDPARARAASIRY